MNERDLFMTALQIEDPARRSAYLDQECGSDAELRQRVEDLLRAFAQAGSFLQQQAVDSGATTDSSLSQLLPNGAAAEKPGTLIGPYKLLQQLGEGGMGSVFMAEQTHPVKRRVALKVIKPGMDSRQIIARFEAERQALALMDHVNIARVLDAGATESGQPYFVMELVHGVPITQYCDDNRLTPRERLELFVPVCQAIQHAHQKGIIHRDIKPSNVMVTLYDGKPVPKVIDFGLAKATEQKLTERTLFTHYGTLVGTLEYMSPEQAETSALGVDTRSDVYSLGVLLYNLLTGTTPLGRKRITGSPYAEILRLIKEEEPPPPSTRLSDSGDALASISAQRRMEPSRLMKMVRGELDWIVMKTLEKDRSRRYESASAFAADVQRYLHDEPVLACPLSLGYRFRKFARRSKGVLAAALAASLVVLIAMVGLAVSNVLIGRESNQKAEALEQTRREKEKSERNLARAEANFQATLGAVDQMLTALFDDEELKKMDRDRNSDISSWTPEERLRDEVLTKARDAQRKRARQILQEFVDRDPANPETRLERAWAYQRLGRMHSGDDHARSVEAYSQAIALLEQLAAESPAMPNRRRELAETYSSLVSPLQALGGRAQRPVVAAQTVTFLTTPSLSSELMQLFIVNCSLWQGMGQPLLFSGVKQARTRAITLYEGLAADFPTDVHYRLALADQYQSLGFESTGVERTEAYQRAVAVWTRLIEDFPANREYRMLLAKRWFVMAGFQGSGFGLPAEGEALFRQGLQVQQKLADDLHVPQDTVDLADNYRALGEFLTSRGQVVEAEASYRQALALFDTLPPHTIPYGGQFGPGVSKVCNRLGHLLKNAHRPQEAEKIFRRSVDFYESLPARDREMDVLNFKVGDRRLRKNETNTESAFFDYYALGELLKDAGRFQEAEPVWRKVLALEEKLAVIEAKRWNGVLRHPWHRRRVAEAHATLGDILRGARQPQKAEQAYRQAVDLQQKLADDFPREEFTARHEMAKAWTGLGKLLKDSGQPDRAVQAFRQALDVYRRAVALSSQESRLDEESIPRRAALGLIVPSPGGPAFPQAAIALHVASLGSYDTPPGPHERIVLCNLGLDLGHQLSNLGKNSEAAEVYRGAVSVGETLVRDYPSERQHAMGLAVTHTNLGIVLERQNKYAESASECRRAIRLKADYASAHCVLGVALSRQGKNAEAETEFREFIRLKPDDAVAHDNLGVALDRQGKHAEAEASYREAVRLKPDFANAHNNLGLALRNLGKHSQAVDAYREAIRLNPNWGLAHYNLGQELLGQGQWAEGIRAYGKLIELEPWHALRHNELAWVLATCPDPSFRDAPRAVALAKKAVQMDPKNGLYWQTLGVAQYRAGDWKAAVAALEKVKELGSPGDSREWFPLALAHWRLGDKAQARQWYDRAVQWMEKNAPQDDELRRFRAEAEKLLELKK